MQPNLKKILRALSLDIRHTLEGTYDNTDAFHPGDLETRLNGLGVWRERPAKPLDELGYLSPEDKAARQVIDAYIAYRAEAGVERADAVSEFVRESAYNWANRLLALRCMEARGIIDEVILQKEIYGRRSLVHNRLARKNPEACAGADEGLFVVLFQEFEERAKELPELFAPASPAIVLRPSLPALKRCLALLSGTQKANGQEAATDDVFCAADALGWAYQYWNTEEKDRVFEKVRTQKGAKIEGADIIPATQLYTEPYMVKFLVQNSLGATWMGMHPDSKLTGGWEYYVKDVDRAPMIEEPPVFTQAKNWSQINADGHWSEHIWTRPDPKLTDIDGIAKYALTFNGYSFYEEVWKAPPGDNWGTLEKFRKEGWPAGFENLRTCLFLLQRAWGRAGQGSDIQAIEDEMHLIYENICEAWENEWPMRAPRIVKPLPDITLLDPACGSGHFLLEAFDLFFQMYAEENRLETDHSELIADDREMIASSILNHNLYGIDIDERAIQITTAALWMKAKEYAPSLLPEDLTTFHHHLVATNIRLPKGKDHLRAFLAKHPEAASLQPALEAIFEGLENVHELGSLVQIEEPVEKELRYLREKYDDSRKHGIQANLFEPIVVQGELPLGIDSYEQWKANTLLQLEQHFAEESEAADALLAFFGISAQRGLALFEMLSGRYDIVTANPPYMGLKNLNSVVKNYIYNHYSLGKYDLYSAFILRCLELVLSSGRVAMVTQNSWMFLQSYSNFRLNNQEDEASVPNFQGILKSCTIELLAHLGPGSFSEIGGEVVKSVLFIFNRSICPDQHKLSAFHLDGFIDSSAKEKALRRVVHTLADFYYTPLQSLFSRLNDSPVIYHINDEIADILINSQHLGAIAQVKPGPQTSNNFRFTRYFWECSTFNSRWFQLSKGGSFKRWAGLNNFVVDWENNGSRIKEYNERNGDHWSRNVRNVDFLFKEGISYNAFGNFFSARLLSDKEICDTKGPGLYLENNKRFPLLGYLNSRFVQYILKLLSPSLDFNPRTICTLPVPDNLPISDMVELAINLKSTLISRELTEFCFDIGCLAEYDIRCIETLLISIEAVIEQMITENFNLSQTTQKVIFKQTGQIAGNLPLLRTYMPLSTFTKDYGELPVEFTNFVRNQVPLYITENELSELKHKLQILYETGFGSYMVDLENEGSDQDIVKDSSGIYFFTPTETFQEEISQKLKIHPISVYGLLREGISQEGWRCLPEEKLVSENRLCVITLRLLGYRWPKQIEKGESIPDWADQDGIIPLTLGLPELTLIERVRARMLEEFPGGNSASLEREFEEIVGESMEKWLSSSFFKHHISQFKKRPIAWQLSSRPGNGAGGKGKKKGLDKAPAFACLVYYHKLDQNTLTTLQSQYVRPLRQSYETELRTLDNNPFLTPEQSSRRIQLDAWIDELKDFESRLEQCARQGFASPALAQVAAKEPLDRWTSRDGQTAQPANRSEFESQEMRYDPDINDGVRVNIAPLQKYGLLAADVLDAKDLEKAIADRAEWRADERRWCREGKLPKPGWWK